MLSKKNHIIVGLNTFNAEFLRISIPALAKLRQSVYLIVHNGNPDTPITGRMIRDLGYRGNLHIINTPAAVGATGARLDILAEADRRKIKSSWMIFIDDTDILIDVDIPPVAAHNFAVMQNTALIKKSLLDMLRAMDNPRNYKPEDLERPHIGIVGTLVRTGMMIQTAKALGKMPDVGTDATLWGCLQTHAKHLDPCAAAIYMDHTNRISVQLGTDPVKKSDDAIVQKYSELFTDLLKS